MEIYGHSVATLPAIAALVYGIIEILKKFVFASNQKFKKYIPIVSAVLGGAMGIIAFFAFPDIIPAQNWYCSIIIGCASGLSAVGANQIKKQSEKKDGDGGGY